MAKPLVQTQNISHSTFDLYRELITSFWMTRLNQHWLIPNATSGIRRGPLTSLCFSGINKPRTERFE